MRDQSLYRSPNIVRAIKSRKFRWTGHVGRMKERSTFTILKFKPTAKGPLGRPWQDHMKIDSKEIGSNTKN